MKNASVLITSVIIERAVLEISSSMALRLFLHFFKRLFKNKSLKSNICCLPFFQNILSSCVRVVAWNGGVRRVEG